MKKIYFYKIFFDLVFGEWTRMSYEFVEVATHDEDRYAVLKKRNENVCAWLTLRLLTENYETQNSEISSRIHVDFGSIVTRGFSLNCDLHLPLPKMSENHLDQ